jgi:hypothetical protein
MLFSPWFIVPVVLFAILFVLFMAFIMWLAHTLEGYPMFLIQNQDRDIGVVSRSFRLGSVPQRSPVLSAYTDGSGVRARSRHDEKIGHHAGRL